MVCVTSDDLMLFIHTFCLFWKLYFLIFSSCMLPKVALSLFFSVYRSSDAGFPTRMRAACQFETKRGKTNQTPAAVSFSFLLPVTNADFLSL